MQRSYNAIISELLIAETKNKVEKNKMRSKMQKKKQFSLQSYRPVLSYHDKLISTRYGRRVSSRDDTSIKLR